MFKNYAWCLVAVISLSVSIVAMAQDDIDLGAADDALDAAIKTDDNAAGGEAAAEEKEAPAAEAAEAKEAAPAAKEEKGEADNGKVVVVEEVSEPEVVEKAEQEESKEEAEGDGNWKHKALMYFPNLFLDLGDTFSLSLGVGAESGALVRLTRWCQIGGMYGSDYFVEKGFERRYGGGYNDGYEFALVAISSEVRTVDPTFGTIPVGIIKRNKATMLHPSDELYDTHVRDFWAVGVDAGWLVMIGFELHPVEIADFFTGIFAYDLLDDNL